MQRLKNNYLVLVLNYKIMADNKDTKEKSIPEGWNLVTLGQIVGDKVDNRGRNPKKYFTTGIPVIDNFMIVGNRKINLSNTRRFIDELSFKNFIRNYLEPGDVLITLVGNGYGNLAIAPIEKSVIIQNTIGIRSNEKSINNFIFYNLSFKKKRITDLNRGAAQPSIKVGDLMNVEILLPTLPEQRTIVNVLSSFDDKIELLREQNKTLEETAQTIFKEWFGKLSVDKPEELPEGWKVGKVTDIIERESISYKCTKKDVNESGKTPIFDQGVDGLYGYTEREPDFIASPDNPVVLFTNHTCNYWFVDYPFCAIQNVIPYRGKDGYDEYFVYFMTKESIQFIEYKGHWPDFEAKDFVIPPVEESKKFSKIAKPILEKISTNKVQIKSLEKTRDTLLPRLMKGDVSVK